MPTLGFHVPEESPLINAVQKRANVRHAGKVSAYVRDLVKEDLLRSAGAGERTIQTRAMSPDVMVELATELLGRLDAEVMTIAVEGQDQRRVLASLLRSFLTSQHSNHQAAEAPPVDKSAAGAGRGAGPAKKTQPPKA